MLVDDPLAFYEEAVDIASSAVGDSCTSVQVDATCRTSAADSNLRDAVVMILLDGSGSTCSGMHCNHHLNVKLVLLVNKQLLVHS